ncbi:hypothetical protein MKW98_001141 [Papaver atlanticum]|uniref:non-specific serine/threonine protein kinase n=1 Tax=Papaver atlanticum TaxID=357466 RepID=A0AAD4SRI6_9MAGN|nr:hypothetical protein MKW98_001141 [Papaver atlanticum]
MSLSGASRVTSNGILELTNDTCKILGHAFYPHPLPFKENSTYSSVFTFATTFIFSVIPKYPGLGGHGLAFVISSTKEPKNSFRNQYLGLPNETSIAEFSTRIVGVEFDTVQSLDLNDINDNHVGIDIGSLISNVSEPAKYFDGHNNKSVNLKSGDLIQAWIKYNGKKKLIIVTISPLGIPKPNQPLILSAIDLTPLMNEYMYIGFSASTGVLSASHNIHGWSFRIGGRAEDLDPSKVPIFMKSRNVVGHKKGFKVGIALACITLFLLVTCGSFQVVRWRKPADESLEEWEIEYGARRFKFSELLAATREFREENLIGTLGYLAPELTKTGKATTCTDVYGYGALMLEVVCCRRPIEPQKNAQELVLVDWVRELHSRGELMRAVDPALELYNPDEAKLVLGLGLLCLHPNPNYRPSMRKIVQYLLGDASTPLLPIDIQLDIQGLISDFSDGYYQSESDPFSSQLTSSKSISGITSLNKEMIPNHGARATY